MVMYMTGLKMWFYRCPHGNQHLNSTACCFAKRAGIGGKDLSLFMIQRLTAQRKLGFSSACRVATFTAAVRKAVNFMLPWQTDGSSVDCHVAHRLLPSWHASSWKHFNCWVSCDTVTDLGLRLLPCLLYHL